MTASRPSEFSLEDNLAQHIACAETLIKLLVEEKAALLDSDVERLSKVCENKSAAALSLQGLSARLNKACGASDGKAVETWIEKHGGKVLLTRWQQLMQLAIRCQQLNAENGAVLLERQTRVRSMLQVMQRDEKPVYGRGGYSPVATPRRSLLTA